MEQPYRANVLIVKSVGMLPGASAEYTSLSMNVQYIKNTGCINTALIFLCRFRIMLYILAYDSIKHNVV